MSGILRNYFALSCQIDGGYLPGFGSLAEASGEATIGGDHIIQAERFSIEPEDYVVIWAQSHNKLKFKEIGFQIVGDGSLAVFSRYDLPTSADNYTPLGTRIRWYNDIHNCKLGPWVRSAQERLSVSNLTSECADSAGLPGILATLDSADTSICDKIIVRNLSDEDIVIIDRFLVQ